MIMSTSTKQEKQGDNPRLTAQKPGPSITNRQPKIQALNTYPGFWHPQESLSLNALNTDLLIIRLHHGPLLHLFLLQRVFLGICLSVFNTTSGCGLYDI